jgi:hypothetical protein
MKVEKVVLRFADRANVDMRFFSFHRIKPFLARVRHLIRTRQNVVAAVLVFA